MALQADRRTQGKEKKMVIHEKVESNTLIKDYNLLI